MSNVKLAIRVRPFTEKELKSEKDRVSVIDVIDEHTVTITNTKVNLSGAGDSRERIRRYYADYTFDSACPITSPTYASQEKVFEMIGGEVLTSLGRGNSACVLAYGQSATGKTHTMIGTDEQPGLVLRLCRALAQLNPFDVTVSFLEIYNEKVHDLLVEAVPYCHSLPRRRGNSRKDLRVREHPQKGPYVQNLRRVAVRDTESLLALVSEGTRRRRTAATKRNTTSSRSHALLDITTPQGTLHLADLAGSEKASWEGIGSGSGGRQKEGANINKSLVALSNVISALVNGSKGRNKFVPYRDSALTWLLKDCFTGGASTYIIATVSPSIGCYGESASTLRWAERARQLPTVKSNISCVTGLQSKAYLQTHYNQLIALLTKNHIRYVPETGVIVYDTHHWQLQNKSNIPNDVLNSNANIGSIMSAVFPKSDQNNSESTASSVASESSDIVNTMDKNIKIVDEINKEVDKLFTPSLERTSSGSNLKVIAPVRHKRRQYRSQEVLPFDGALQTHSSNTSLSDLNPVKTQDQSDKTKVTILHESQRAEIVASVTERLYSKLKKKEEAAAAKMESVVDKKIAEPLSELRICTNARQRLMEISQKALRNKRRIGIPAYTQTRVSVIRVKDQAIDVQTDLGFYIINNENMNVTTHRDVGTETIPMTPRCKEISVGSKYGTLNLADRSTATDTNKIIYNHSGVMTDVVLKNEQGTQTKILPPPRKKRGHKPKKEIKSNFEELPNNDSSPSPVISINISHSYLCDSETQSSDDNLDYKENDDSITVAATPDLLTSHLDSCNTDHNPEYCSIRANESMNIVSPIKINVEEYVDDEFNESEEYYSLPRVTIDPSKETSFGDMRNMILGRNNDVYPYNIILSPPKERLQKNVVTFQDNGSSEPNTNVRKANEELDEENITNKGPEFNIHACDESECAISDSMSTSSSKLETNSFIWKPPSKCKNLNHIRKSYTPVYKSNTRKTARDHLCSSLLSGYSSSDSLSTSSYENTQQQNDRMSRFDEAERLLIKSCKDLEKSANDYENRYLKSYNSGRREHNAGHARTPTEYLQHLIKLRREVVQAESESTN